MPPGPARVRLRATPVAEKLFLRGHLLQRHRGCDEDSVRCTQQCPLAEESRHLQAEVRLLLYGKRNRRYKIYFAIHKETKTIRVFHVRHWARKPSDTGEFDDLMDDTAEQDGA